MKYKTHCQACGVDYEGLVYTPRCKACNAPKVSEYITGYGVTLIEYANVATCEHSPLYRIENESAGGVGCPICNAERAAPIAQDPVACDVADCESCSLRNLEQECAEYQEYLLCCAEMIGPEVYRIQFGY